MKNKRLYRVVSSVLPKPNEIVPLSNEESHYVSHVLRLSPGSIIEAISGSGQATMVKLVAGNKKNDPWGIQAFDPEETRFSDPLETVPITLYISVLKSEAMDWLIEKSVEIGVRSIQPVISERSLVHETKERWQKRADQALKQCERLNRLEILPLAPWSEAFRKLSEDTTKGLPHWVASEARRLEAPFLGKLLEIEKPKSLNLWIGPEGGWSPSELDAYRRLKVPEFSLGPLVLRAETAALSSLAIAIDFLRRNS
jgi:16S rRNA (uracil1498-N3)-methyltransferase